MRNIVYKKAATFRLQPFVVIRNLGRLKRLGIFQKGISKFIKLSKLPNFTKFPNQKT